MGRNGDRLGQATRYFYTEYAPYNQVVFNQGIADCRLFYIFNVISIFLSKNLYFNNI